MTPHALEVSWVFENLRDAFSGLINSCSKFEFYGRLELAANHAIAAEPRIGAAELCSAIVDEAEVILEDMGQRRFRALSVAAGVAIAADYKESRA